MSTEFSQGIGWGPDVTIHDGTPTPVIDIVTLHQHPLLSTAAAKLRWAEGHVNALTHNLIALFADPADHAVLRADLDPDTGYHIFRVESLPDTTEWAEDFQHAIADVANNLRSALDKLAWKSACAKVHGVPDDPPGVKFPICDTPNEWTKAGRARKQLVSAHCGFIELEQPHHGQGTRVDVWHGAYIHPLTLLRDLSNEDKHRDTVPVLLTPNQFQFRPGDFAKLEGTIDCAPLNKGQEMAIGLEVLQARFLDRTEPHIDDAARALPEVSLPEGRVAIPTMTRLLSTVHVILSEFAQHFPGP